MRFSLLSARRALLLGAVALAGVAAAGPAAAQAWTDKPIRIIVPFPAGGITDILARLVAKGITANTGQTIVVINRPGAGGNIGTAAVAQSAPDGTTLVVSPTGNFVINQFMYRNMPYSPEKDLVPVTVVAQSPIVMVVNPQVPAHNAKELIDYARKNPGKLNAGSGGNGTASHLSLEVLRGTARIEFQHVPFNGTQPCRVEVLAGRVDMAMDNYATYAADIRAGTVRALAVGSAKRSQFMPDVPTLAEAAVPGYLSSVWYALAAPAGTPPAMVEAIYRETMKVLKSPEVEQTIKDAGAEVVGESPAATRDFFAGEARHWKAAVAASGAKLD